MFLNIFLLDENFQIKGTKMKLRIIENINNPEMLEKLYRENKNDFEKSFSVISETYNSELVNFWKLRLSEDKESNLIKISRNDFFAILIITLITGVLLKLPEIIPNLNPETFYMKYLAIFVFNGLIVFTFWRNKIFDVRKIILYLFTILLMLSFVYLLPNYKSDSITLAFIHIPLLMWCLFGLAYVSFDYKNLVKRIRFIQFNGEMLIMTGLLLIAGGFLTGITFGLFNVIGMNIENFYFNNIVVFGGVATPIVAFYLIGIYPNITSKISPVIARIFTPLILIMLLVYLITIIFSHNQFLEDRNLLIVFNLMLFIVTAIIVFAISEQNKLKDKNINILILFALAITAIVINSFALTAIVTRVLIGITPNRIVVLISNILIFLNLILIAKDLYKSYHQIKFLNSVENTVSKFLTIYMVYTLLVIFIFPFMFGFK